MDSKAIDMNLDMVMKKEINDSVKTSLAKKIESPVMNPEVKKYADYNKLAEVAMKPLLNKDGMIALKTKVGGTTKKPDVKLTQPQLDTLGEVVKSAAGSVAIEAGKGVAKETVKKLLNEDQQKVLDGVGGLLIKK